MTKKKRIRVAILFGGKSAEHEVSIHSAKNVFRALDRKKYEPVLIGIDKKGGWHLGTGERFLQGQKLLPVITRKKQMEIMPTTGSLKMDKVDVVFPILHGPLGEDGTVQGMLKLMNVPFVGAGVLGSALGMDKDVMKRLLREAKIPVVRFIVLHAGDKINFDAIRKKLGVPFFVKPANLGSSVGVKKVKEKSEFAKAVRGAFRYDRKILVEEYLKGREIECSVLGNEKPVASLPGEIIPRHEFYSYEAKYLDPDGAELKAPADLSPRIVKRVQEMALSVFRALCCEGMARVDFFLTSGGKLYVNEINTIPGFTAISMYPRLWEISGMSYTKLVDHLIELALERHKKESKLKNSF